MTPQISNNADQANAQSSAQHMPLPAAFQRKIESVLNTDFSDVTLCVSDLPERLNTMVFASGRKVYIAPAVLKLRKKAFSFILGHALTHIWQQTSRKELYTRATVVTDAFEEQQADIIASIMSGITLSRDFSYNDAPALVIDDAAFEGIGIIQI